MRFISQISEVSIKDMEDLRGLSIDNSGKNPVECNKKLKRIEMAEKIVRGFKLYMKCGDDLEMHEINKWIKHLVKFNGVECVWLDYFTDILPTVQVGGSSNRYEQMAEVARQIKSLKKQIPIPIITLAQLKRESEDRRPRKSDIAESAVTERIADGIVLIDRPREWTTEHDRKYRWFTGRQVTPQDLKDACALIVDKNRFGPQSVSFYKFDAKYMKFSDELEPPQATI